MSDQVPVTHRMVADGELEHVVEDQAPAADRRRLKPKENSFR